MQKHQRFTAAFFNKLELVLLFDFVFHGQSIRFGLFQYCNSGTKIIVLPQKMSSPRYKSVPLNANIGASSCPEVMFFLKGQAGTYLYMIHTNSKPTGFSQRPQHSLRRCEKY